MWESNKTREAITRQDGSVVPNDLDKARKELLSELESLQLDTRDLNGELSIESQTYARTWARYLQGECPLQDAQQVWDGYNAEIEAKSRVSAFYRWGPTLPRLLPQYARFLTDETAPLDDFSRRILDLCHFHGALMNRFLYQVVLHGPVAAVYEYLRDDGTSDETALRALLNHGSFPLAVDPPNSPDEPSAPPQPTALGRFLLTLIPHQLGLVTDLLARPTQPNYFKRNLATFVALLATYPQDRRSLPVAWEVAQHAPPLLAGVCASSLLRYDPTGFDMDLQRRTGLTWGTPEERVAACHALLEAERDLVDDLLQMRQLLWGPRQWSDTNPMDAAIPAWLEKSVPLAWWMPLFSAVADQRVFQLLGIGKGPGMNFWRELGKLSRRRAVLIEVQAGFRSYVTRDSFLLAYTRRSGEALIRAGNCLDVSSDAIREAFLPRLGFATQAQCILPYGGASQRQLRAHVETDGSVVLADSQGKTLTILPTATTRDDPAQVARARRILQTLRWQISLVMSTGVTLLTEAYKENRSWQIAQWRATYMHHPLLRLLAQRVIWQVTGASDPAIEFRLTDDNHFTSAGGDRLDLPEHGEIRVVQAGTMSDANRELWQRQLSEHATVTLLDQLSVQLP